jgi:hypothetical protein
MMMRGITGPTMRMRAGQRLLALSVLCSFGMWVLFAGGAQAAIKRRPDTVISVKSRHAARAGLTVERRSIRAEDTSGGAVVDDPNCEQNVLPANDDGSTDAVSLPFTLSFFGTDYSQLYVNNNGNVTFDAPMGTYTPFDIDADTPPIIAPFFADVDTRGDGSGLVTYGDTTFEGHPAFCVDWPDVGYYDSETDKLNDFQLLLVDRDDVAPGDFDIVFNYDQIQWETGDASGGVDGLGGTSAGVGYSAGDGNASDFFQLPGSLVNGAFLDSNPTTGLVDNSYGNSLPGRYIFHVTPTPGGTTSGGLGISRPYPELGYGYSFANHGLSSYLSDANISSPEDVLSSSQASSIFSDWSSIGSSATRTHELDNLYAQSNGGVCFGLALSAGRFDAGLVPLYDPTSGRSDNEWQTAANSGWGSSSTEVLPAPGESGDSNYDQEFLSLVEGDFVSQFSRQVSTSLQQQHYAYADPTSGVTALEDQLQSVMQDGVDGYSSLASPGGGNGFALIQLNTVTPTIEGDHYDGHEILAYSAEVEPDGTLQIDGWDNNSPDTAPNPAAIDIQPDGSWTYNEQYADGRYGDEFSMSGAPGENLGELAVFPLYSPHGLDFNPQEAGGGLGSGAYVDVAPGSAIASATDASDEPVDIEAVADDSTSGDDGAMVDLPSGAGTVTLDGAAPSFDVRGPDVYMTASGGGSADSTTVAADTNAGSIGTDGTPGVLSVSRSDQDISSTGVGTLGVASDGTVTTTGDSGTVDITASFDDSSGNPRTVTLYSGSAPANGSLSFSAAQVSAVEVPPTSSGTPAPSPSSGSTPTGTGSAGTSSPHRATISPWTRRVRKELSRLLRLSPARARISFVLRRDGLTAHFRAPSSGRLTLQWFALSGPSHWSLRRREHLIGAAHVRARHPGEVQAVIRLTAYGRHLLGREGTTRLIAKASFSAVGHATTSATRRLTLRR